jgi:RND family efflux transporter MFP subunit
MNRPWNNRVVLGAAAVLAVAAVAAVGVLAVRVSAQDAKAPAAGAPATPGTPASAGTPGAPATPGAAARPALVVTAVRPSRVEVADRLSANGSIAAWQEAIIGAEVSGLRLAEVRVNVGDAVRRGQVLAVFAADTVRADLASAEAMLAEARAGQGEAEAALGEARANAERARQVKDSGALSAQQVTQYMTAEQTAQARVMSAQARVQSAQAQVRSQQLRLSHVQVLAPDDGVISARTATVGAVTAPGQELFRMVRQNRLEWRAEVTATELERIRPNMPVDVMPANGAQIKGTVRMVGPTVDPQSRNGIVYVDLPPGASARSGTFARGEFSLGSSAALTVPQQSVVVRDGFSYVFRLNPDGRVVQQKVQTGRRVGDRVEIVEGLKPEVSIVASGAGFLNDGDLVKVTP